MFAIRARKKSISEKDFMDSVNKVRMEDGMNEVEAKWGRREGRVAAQVFIIFDSLPQVIKGYQKFSATPRYMVYN